MQISARRDEDEDYKFYKCEIGLLLKHFDVAVIKVEVDGSDSFNGFDYVPIHGGVSRNIPFGIEVFTIGLVKRQGYHFLCAMLSHKNQDENTDYYSLAKETKFEAKREIADHNFFNDRPHRVIKGSFSSDPAMHPELKYLQIHFRGMSDFEGLYGAPALDAKGRVIGMIQSHRFSVNGVTAAALEAAVRCYKETLE